MEFCRGFAVWGYGRVVFALVDHCGGLCWCTQFCEVSCGLLRNSDLVAALFPLDSGALMTAASQQALRTQAWISRTFTHAKQRGCSDILSQKKFCVDFQPTLPLSLSLFLSPGLWCSLSLSLSLSCLLACTACGLEVKNPRTLRRSATLISLSLSLMCAS